MLEWHPNTQALADAFAENVEAGLRGDDEEEVDAAKRCNQYVHFCNKGTTRESKMKNTPILFKVNPDAAEYEQINQLTEAIEKASKDGVRLDAVIKHPEFGELLLECGNSSPVHPSKKNKDDHHAHGVKHSLEERHNVTSRDIATAILKGKIEQHEGVSSRLIARYNGVLVILEREMKKGSGRISVNRAKLHTAMRRE